MFYDDPPVAFDAFALICEIRQHVDAVTNRHWNECRSYHAMYRVTVNL